MRRLILLLLLCSAAAGRGQDTFSIVAVDTVTGEFGSAGATCLAGQGSFKGAVIISDILPGRGAIHTQAQWSPDNQYMASELMASGLSPQEIIDSIQKIDVDENPTVRQYGIVDTKDGHPRSAAFTGTNCMDYKNHIVGANYAIQGNILLGQQILDSMEARYLRETGTLADKLMAALQGANVRGADTRCYDSVKSSASSFIRIAKPTDEPGLFTLELIVPRTAGGRDPIDSLQTLYNAWKSGVPVDRFSNSSFEVSLGNGELVLVNKTNERFGKLTVEVSDVAGRILLRKEVSGSSLRVAAESLRGVCLVRVFDGDAVLYAGKFVVQ